MMIKPIRFPASGSTAGQPSQPALVTQRGVLFEANCFDVLNRLADGSVDCVFADPPFNLGKDYGSNRVEDKLTNDRYLQWTQSWLTECIRVLKPGGSLFVYHIPRWMTEINSYLSRLDAMEFRSWIAIKMKNGFPIRGRLHPAHYGLLYYVKRGAAFKFHKIRIPSPVCRHCGKLLRDYGGYRKKYKTQKGNRNVPLIQLADFWDDTSPNIHKKSRPKSMNELPTNIPERAILISTNRGDVVLDPFAGGGSTLEACEQNSRYWIGVELGTTTYAKDRVLQNTCARSRKTLPKKLRKALKW